MFPLLLGLSAVLGAAGHLSAKSTNEKAQQLVKEAQKAYNDAKDILANSQKKNRRYHA